MALRDGYGYSKFLCIDYIYQSEKEKRTLEKMTKIPYSRLNVHVTAKVIQTHMSSQGPTET